MPKKYSPAAYQRRKGAAAGFTIDVSAGYQRIDTGMAPMDAVNMAADQIAGLPYEMAVIVAPDGTMFVAKGTQNKVTPPYIQAERAGYRRQDMLDLHNHPAEGTRPFGGPSSGADWETMLFNGQTVNYIAAKEGRYTLRVTDVSKTSQVRKFFDTGRSGRKQSNFMRNVNKAYRSECLPGQRYGKRGDYMKACYDTLKKFGARYGFDIEFQPNAGWENLYNS